MTQDDDKPEPLVIMMTAYDQSHLNTCVRQGLVQHVLVKPILPSDLLNTLLGLTTSLQPADRDQSVGLVNLSGVRILVAEDNPINQQIVRELLVAAGASVTMASNGLEALDAVARAPVDLILMDVQMPGMDGLTATRQLRANPDYQAIPVIALTAHALPDERERCLATGMNDFVTKPLDECQLVNAIQRALGGQQSSLPTSIDQARSANDSDTEAGASPDGVPLLNLDAALRRLGGRRPLLNKQLTAFNTQFNDCIVRLSDDMANQDWPTAHRAAHSLRGVAATLGAEQLAQQAGTLEQCLNKRLADPVNKDDLTLEGLVAGLAEIFTATQNAIEAHLNALAPQPAMPEAIEQLSEVGPLLDALDTQLASNDLAAASTLQTVLQRVPAGQLTAGLTSLEQAIDRLDYPAARRALQEVRGQIQ